MQFTNIRGNVPTRLRKLMESDADGIVLAKAAWDRLMTAPGEEFSPMQEELRAILAAVQWQVLPLSINPNAPAQGALAVEVLKNREDIKRLFSSIHCHETYFCAQQERLVLGRFGGGCHQKIGVATLNRSYGQITFLRGKTEVGEILDHTSIVPPGKTRSFPVCSDLGVFSDLFSTQRQALNAALPPDAKSLFISRADAWSDRFKFSGIVWTAGVTTWFKLAAQGLWVHGTADSLGEQESANLESLAPQPANWYRLTHSDAENTSAKDGKSIASYQLTYKPVSEQPALKEFYFWKSASQFLTAIQRYPDIKYKLHACGPGKTYDFLRRFFNETTDIFLFLNEAEWRKQCQK